jgi:hypothetical protein
MTRAARVLGIGFPRDVPIPTRMTACGDGIHTALGQFGSMVDCVCDRMAIDLTAYPPAADPLRIVLLDVAMDTVPVDAVRRLSGRLVRP